ncbi:MAG: hypothetical protein V4560_01510 [Bacteroidota bacterium]
MEIKHLNKNQRTFVEFWRKSNGDIRFALVGVKQHAGCYNIQKKRELNGGDN